MSEYFVGVVNLAFNCHNNHFVLRIINHYLLTQACTIPATKPPSEFWVLLVVTNKNHGQPFVQCAKISKHFLMVALYYPEEIPLNLGSLNSITPLF